MTREELIEAAWRKAGKRWYVIISREAVADVADIVLEEAMTACERSMKDRRSTTWNSACGACQERIRSLMGE